MISRNIQIDTEVYKSQKEIFDLIWSDIANYGFDFVLDYGLCITLIGWNIRNIVYSSYPGPKLWIGPIQDALLMKAQAASFDDNQSNCYIIDMANISHIQMFDKIQDIICSRGFFNIFKEGFVVKLTNRLYGNSKNNILYVGSIKEQANETDGGRNFSIIS